MRSRHEARVGGVVVERRDETATVGALIDHGAARVTVQLDARVTTHDRRHVHVDGVWLAHARQVLVLVLVETFVCDQSSQRSVSLYGASSTKARGRGSLC